MSTSEEYGAALMVTPFALNMPQVPKPVNQYLDKVVALAMQDTAVMRAVDASPAAESGFQTVYRMVRNAAAQQVGLRFNWALFKNPSGLLHFQLTQYRGPQRRGR